MWKQGLQRLTPSLLLVAGCSGEPSESDRARDAGDFARYLRDADFRRAELEASLVNPADGYAKRRLERYGEAWDALPVWNPRTLPITTTDFGRTSFTTALGENARALVIRDAARAADEDALRTLGQEAFFAFPVQLLPDAEAALGSKETAEKYGFAIDTATGRVGGLVRAEMADGSSRLALTCASCHVGRREGRPVVGAPNDALDLGHLAVDTGGVQPELASRLMAWGPGRIDVSSDDGSEPARIPDLRPVRFLTHLQQDATVAQRSVVSLALRIETLVITSHDEDLRPPREVALGLALAVWALADDLPDVPRADGAAARGLEVHRRACSSCHASDGFTGPPVPLAIVGTDPSLGLSPERGTGSYRVPSLRGVGSRGPLLHDASAPSLAVFFDPMRITPDYNGGRTPGPIVGHPWNIDLPADDRASLISFLETL
jgi:mono/diheme cytochrome c family protein